MIRRKNKKIIIIQGHTLTTKTLAGLSSPLKQITLKLVKLPHFASRYTYKLVMWKLRNLANSPRLCFFPFFEDIYVISKISHFRVNRGNLDAGKSVVREE